MQACASHGAFVFVSIKSLHFLGVNRWHQSGCFSLVWWASAMRCDAAAAADAVDDAMCIYLLKNRGESSESRASKWPKTMPVATRDDANDDDDDIKYF